MRTNCSDGFTVFELVVAMAVTFLLIAAAIPNFQQMKAQLNTTEDSRALMYYFAELRTEAIRTKSPLQITFTSTGFSWDLLNDGTVDGTYEFHDQVGWDGTVPSPIVINGFGLIPAMTSAVTITIKGGNSSVPLLINSNGHIQI